MNEMQAGDGMRMAATRDDILYDLDCSGSAQTIGSSTARLRHSHVDEKFGALDNTDGYTNTYADTLGAAAADPNFVPATVLSSANLPNEGSVSTQLVPLD